ncbi:hypothetical protein EDEG_01275 [Edhazardia aedis USNM 41457]|uniref:USP domain-containing protein n=1 Tax=Edhazardia aedis (strain USNM 41457) TaxID=1003232 RepID=J9DT80_EDHAE|nr:hypothetical protein EDEG_01275 [Edhazardia aedis USNM 41457]|eukprot:EJW04507.2 hypothetical protein EDEG_01275 [Edhazardia aedis USNM 41457]
MHPYSRKMQPINFDEEHVFFIKDLSVEQEMSLIRKILNKKPEKPLQKSSGNNLLPEKNELLCSKHALNYSTIKINKLVNREIETLIILSLLSMDPFLNTIVTFNERIGRINLKIIKKLYNIILKSKDKCLDLGDPSLRFNLNRTNDDNEFQICHQLLQTLHDDFLSHFFFEEDDWTSIGEQKFVKDKGVYQNFSPISDLFCGRLKIHDQKFVLKYFDILKIDNTNQLTIEKALESCFCSDTDKKSFSKLPVCLVIHCNERLQINETLKTKELEYVITSFITICNKEYIFYTIQNGKNICYKNGRILNIENLDAYEGNLVFLFYTRKTITAF